MGTVGARPCALAADLCRDALDRLHLFGLLRLTRAVVSGLHVHTEALESSAGAHYSTAADLTERLVLVHGLDYRTAYRLVGRAVATAFADDRPLRGADLMVAADQFGMTVPAGIQDTAEASRDARQIALGRDVPGGSAPTRVRDHCAAVDRFVLDGRTWATHSRRYADEAEQALVDRARTMWSP